MPVTNTNRKGRTYFLCTGKTKTGKPRYFFAAEPKGPLVEKLPSGYQIQESVNGVVSLSKIQPILLSDEDILVVNTALQAHPKAQHYRLDVKPKMISIYEQVGPDIVELGSQLAADFGQILTNKLLQQLRETADRYAQFTPVLRFILVDEDSRAFSAQRMCYLGSVDDWIDVGYSHSLSELANTLIPTLGTDAFYGLY